MTPAARERSQVRSPVLLLSAAAWIMLVAGTGGMALHIHHAAVPLEMLLAHNPPASLAASWALMLAAMMLPLVIAPIRHVRDRSFARRRTRAIALFLTGYSAVWMAAGVLLLALALAIPVAVPGSVVPVALALALIWQCSPLKQRCLNRCHFHPELAAFGPAADLGALRFGWTHGIWCAGSCWALMLLPLLLSRGHLAAMAAVTLLLFAERLERPMPPQWRWRVPAKAARLVFAQARMAVNH